MLIQWSGLPSTEATWEDLTCIQSKFPDFNLEGKVSLNGGSIDENQVWSEEVNEQMEEVATE